MVSGSRCKPNAPVPAASRNAALAPQLRHDDFSWLSLDRNAIVGSSTTYLAGYHEGVPISKRIEHSMHPMPLS
jgi:hypothetical protein